LQLCAAVSQVPVCPFGMGGQSVLSQHPVDGTQIIEATHFFIDPQLKSQPALPQTAVPLAGATHFTQDAPHWSVELLSMHVTPHRCWLLMQVTAAPPAPL
jgi:hypothetical protein